MGCGASRDSANGADIENIMNKSLRVPHSTRHNYVWVREDVNMTDVYDVMANVGSGSMGEVSFVKKKQVASERMAELSASQHDEMKSQKTKRRKYACKTINTVRFTDAEIKEFMNEISILRDLDHPNIIQMFEVYKKKRKCWIIMELCTGGDLTKRIDEMTEMNVAVVMGQIVRAISYMHSRNVCHRDIKMENILYTDSSPDSSVKLIDFGLSDKFTKGEKMQKACGTIYSAAPEVLTGQGATEYTDIWSIGCLAFIMLSGEYPFLKEMSDLLDGEKMNRLKGAEFTFSYAWQLRGISQYARDFVTRCLQKEPAQRWTAKEALEFTRGKWIPYLESMEKAKESRVVPDTIQEDATCTTTSSTQQANTGKKKRDRTRVNTGMVKGMGKFVLYGELKKTILMTMAHTMDKSSLHELEEIFTSLDSEGSGTVSLIDLKNALKRMHSDKQLDDETLEKLFYGIDVDASGQIHYQEFLAAVVESQGLITMEHLADAFDRLDSDDKGYISKKDLKNLLGTDYNEAKVDKMISEADHDHDGQIDYDEFLRLMFEDPTSGLDVLGKNMVLKEDVTLVDKLAPVELSRDIKSNLETAMSHDSAVSHDSTMSDEPSDDTK